jgi:MATE family multidrug resistance protein
MARLSFAASTDIGELVWDDDELDEEEAVEEFHLWHETKLLFNISLPAVAVQISVLFIFPLTASVVGRQLGTEALAGFSLGSLVGNLTCLSIMVGALTAADTLMPRAYGSERYEELGRLAIRGFVMCSLLLVAPIVPLCTAMEWIFDQLGQDEYASHLASEWIRIYLIGVPAMLLFRVVQSFLNAQHKVWPLVYASMTACFVVHPMFLKYFIPRFGFVGSSLAIALTQYVMCGLLLLYLYIHPVYKAETWPGLSAKYFVEAVSPVPMMSFLSLSLGGVLSLSEWWFWYVAFGLGVCMCVCSTTNSHAPTVLLFLNSLTCVVVVVVAVVAVVLHTGKRAVSLSVPLASFPWWFIRLPTI